MAANHTLTETGQPVGHGLPRYSAAIAKCQAEEDLIRTTNRFLDEINQYNEEQKNACRAAWATRLIEIVRGHR